MAISATPHVAHSTISELYHTGTTPETQEVLGLLWDATWGIFDAPLYVGFLVGMIGFALLGLAMLQTPAFGKVFGWISLVLGLAGFVAAVLQLMDPASLVGAISFFVYIILYFVLGSKVFRLSKTA